MLDSSMALHLEWVMVVGGGHMNKTGKLHTEDPCVGCILSSANTSTIINSERCFSSIQLFKKAKWRSLQL